MGRGASRLLGGNDHAHVELEDLLARWLSVDQALLFSSGYAANVGVLSALIERNDWVVSDALNHASIIDGLRLTRARVVVVPHLDVVAVAEALRRSEGRRAWVVTETYFSMDADTPDLKQLRSVCNDHRAALVVDEAHAMGVFGPEGRGLCAAEGITPDVCVGTLGKAFGAAGAFVAGCDLLIDWLWNRARSHVFSTAMSPRVAAAARTNVDHAISHPSLRERAVHHGARFREAMRAAGADVRGHGPIVPWVLGTEELTLRTAEELRRRQVYAVAIRPPTVPENTSRIRFVFTARHTEGDVDDAIDAARATLECLHR
jgi:8-amino-7-oxononanoate synthase